MSNVSGIGNSIAAALIMGLVSALADLIWAVMQLEHRMVFGLVHGALLFMCMGLVLGFFAGSRGATWKGAGAELLAGLAAALSFYLLFPLLGWLAMLVAWMGLWILTAFVNRWISNTAATSAMTAARGVAAALVSGAAFYVVSGTLWLNPNGSDPNYLINFALWTAAFLPGFLALFVQLPGRSSDHAP